MRIVQLIMARQYRGAEVFASQLAQELVALGHEVCYVSLYKSEGKEYRPEGIEYIDLNATKGGVLNINLIRKLRQFIKEFKPDVVQANAGDTLKYAVLVRLLFGYSYAILFRNASTVSQYLKSTPQKWLAAFLFQQCDYIVSVSERSRTDLVNLFPFCEGKISVIPIGISGKRYNRLEEFDNVHVHIVHVGGFTFEKNHEGLLRIFKEVKNKIPNAILWLVGDGPLQKKVIKLTHALSLEDSVFFTGAVTNAMDFIHTANVLVLPSHIEGLPGVILEAFYCKTPVVAYDVGGVKEVVASGRTGWLTAKDDEATFVNAVLEAINNEEQKKEIAENAFTKVMEEFDNALIAKRFLTVYQSLLTT